MWGPWNETVATVMEDEITGVDLLSSSFESFCAIAAISISLLLASAGGIGGGGILVPLFILMLHWSPRYAIPLSNVTIFAGGIMNTYMNIGKRHPTANRPLIDWDLVMIMEPMTILGALFGSFLNRILPEFLLIFLLAIVLAATANRTLSKGLTLWGKESEENRKKKIKGNMRSEAAKDDEVGKYIPVPRNDDDDDDKDSSGDEEEDEERGLSSFHAGDRVHVRDHVDDPWQVGVVAEVDARYPLKPWVKVEESRGRAIVWNYCEPVRRDKARRGGGSASAAGALSPNERSAQEELEGGDVVTEMGVHDMIDKYITVGTPASDQALTGFAPLPWPVGMAKGEKLLCQRSSGEWCHAKVHAFEDWPPEGGTLTLQVDKYRRKVLDLSKKRHLQRVRVPKSKLRALRDPLSAAKTKESAAASSKSKPPSEKAGESSSPRRPKRVVEEEEEEEENRWDDDDDDEEEEEEEEGSPAGSKAARLEAILKQESVHDGTKIGLLFLSFIGVAGLDMAKELAPCGSQPYVLSTALTIPYVLVFFFGYRSYLMRRQKEKVACGYPFQEGDVRWDDRSTVVYPVLCVFAGFFAGMFGVGGGIIKGPLMLEMGIPPPVAAANAAAMILFTTATACLSFFLFGAVDYQVAALLFVLGMLFTGIGQFVVAVAIKRANRQSLIILSMAFVVVLSACLLTLRSLLDAASAPGGVAALVQMGSVCEPPGGGGGDEDDVHHGRPHRKPWGMSPWEYVASMNGGSGAPSGGAPPSGNTYGGGYYGNSYGGWGPGGEGTYNQGPGYGNGGNGNWPNWSSGGGWGKGD